MHLLDCRDVGRSCERTGFEPVPSGEPKGEHLDWKNFENWSYGVDDRMDSKETGGGVESSPSAVIWPKSNHGVDCGHINPTQTHQH